jgi:hypothetical protein
MPFYRDLCNRYTQLLGKQQEFYVEYPGSEMLSRKYLLCSAPREEFETALCVTNVPDADYA